MPRSRSNRPRCPLFAQVKLLVPYTSNGRNITLSNYYHSPCPGAARRSLRAPRADPPEVKHTRPPDTARRPKTLRYSQSRVEATLGARNGGASIHIPVPKSHHVPPPLRTHLAAGGLWPGHAPGSTFSPNPSSRGVDRSAGRVPTPERAQPAPPHRAQSAHGRGASRGPKDMPGRQSRPPP